eukprot:5374342-Prymnesium_polylepis.1
MNIRLASQGLRLGESLIRQVTDSLAFVISFLKPVDPCVAATWGTDSFLMILPFRFLEVSLLGRAGHLRFTSRNAIPLASDFRDSERVASLAPQPSRPGG